MSQYVAPAANLTDRDVLLLIDQKLFNLSDQLYGNGKPGEIALIHDRISALKESLMLLKSWQDERSGASSMAVRWLPIAIALSALAISWAKH